MRFFIFLLALASVARAEDVPGTPFKAPGIDNGFVIDGRIYSGSQPEGDAAFAELARLGIKTIVSVDGSKPDVATAHRFGLRYIHLPFGYDGLPPERVVELARVAQTTDGPIYVHCHHGKHRGPAAVAVMCEAIANWSPQKAEAWLREAGTSDDYPGLFRSVREFHAPTKEQLARVGEFPEIARTPEMVDMMVAIDERFDSLKAVQKAGWKTPPGHPDLAPVHEATLLWEQFRELARTEDTAKRPEDYREKLAAAEKAMDALRAGLRETPDAMALDTAFKQAGQACAACHKTYRNEKK